MKAIATTTENGIFKTLFWSPEDLAIFEEFDGRMHPTGINGVCTLEDAIEVVQSEFVDVDLLDIE